MIEGVKVITTKLPTYLGQLLQEDRTIKLVFVQVQFIAYTGCLKIFDSRFYSA